MAEAARKTCAAVALLLRVHVRIRYRVTGYIGLLLWRLSPLCEIPRGSQPLIAVHDLRFVNSLKVITSKISFTLRSKAIDTHPRMYETAKLRNLGVSVILV
ncbi:hypothetical protein BofuT4_P021470.1 [Botrytis cinerea T4]|uniref:Uncharacterized protein n=1 Tax=Botryotinia fuckeliana (strain T4) TaxID=999810 RepID=G2YJF4_BOTF4|nr:hypothetical protein BofuT4_P021470.1 [Botrytis cinerea T4]